MTRKFPMNTIRAVVRRLMDGISYTIIKADTGASKGFISRVNTVLHTLEITPEQFLKQTDAEIQNAIYPPRVDSWQDPDWASVNELLKKPHMTRQMVYEAYCESLPERAKRYSYPSFCRKLKEWRHDSLPFEVSPNLLHDPGDEMEIDFAGDSLEWIDENAEIHKARVFVQVFENETQTAWAAGIIDALHYFGTSPRVLIMDNAKALVRNPKWTEAEIQPRILDICSHYGMDAQNCPVRHPKDKNRVEAAVCNIELWGIGKLEVVSNGYVLAKDMADLRTMVLKHLNDFNDRSWRTPQRNGSRRIMFEEEELPRMATPLPPRYELGEWMVLRVDKGHCVRLRRSEGSHRYSVPVAYTGKQVCVKLTEHKVQVFDVETAVLIATHERCYNANGEKTHILEQHLTVAEQRSRLSPAQWTRKFNEQLGISKPVADLFETAVFENEIYMRARGICFGVFGLGKGYKSDIIQKAMEKALEMKLLKYPYIKQLCEQYFLESRSATLFNDDSQNDEYLTTTHENIRNDYE